MDDGNTKKTPILSVIVPVYNAENDLERQLDSVLGNDLQDFEVILIDDGSTDASASILQAHAERDSRIRLIVQRNQGLVAALNRGLRLASAPWVARMDIDDVALPSRFSVQLALAEQHPDVVCVGSGFLAIDAASRVLATRRVPKSHSVLLDRLITTRTCFPHASALFRRDLVIKLGGYRSCMHRAQDTDLWLRMAEQGVLAAVQEPLVLIRQHGQQLSAGEGAREQLVMGWAAVVSHLLRSQGLPDPLAGEAEQLPALRQLIAEGLHRSGLNRVRALKTSLKQLLRQPSWTACVSWLQTLVSELRRSPRLLIVLTAEGQVTKRLASHFAAEWSRLP